MSFPEAIEGKSLFAVIAEIMNKPYCYNDLRVSDLSSLFL